MRDSTVLLKSWTFICARTFSSVENEVPGRVTMFCFIRKVRSKILLMEEDYNGFNLITKERRIFSSPLCLRLGS